MGRSPPLRPRTGRHVTWASSLSSILGPPPSSPGCTPSPLHASSHASCSVPRTSQPSRPPSPPTSPSTDNEGWTLVTRKKSIKPPLPPPLSSLLILGRLPLRSGFNSFIGGAFAVDSVVIWRRAVVTLAVVSDVVVLVTLPSPAPYRLVIGASIILGTSLLQVFWIPSLAITMVDDPLLAVLRRSEPTAVAVGLLPCLNDLEDGPVTVLHRVINAPHLISTAPHRIAGILVTPPHLAVLPHLLRHPSLDWRIPHLTLLPLAMIPSLQSPPPVSRSLHPPSPPYPSAPPLNCLPPARCSDLMPLPRSPLALPPLPPSAMNCPLVGPTGGGAGNLFA